MEVDVLHAQGMVHAAYEKLYAGSDGYAVELCEKCGCQISRKKDGRTVYDGLSTARAGVYFMGCGCSAPSNFPCITSNTHSNDVVDAIYKGMGLVVDREIEGDLADVYVD